MPKGESEGRVAVQVYIRPSQLRELRELAAIEDRPVSWLVRKAIEEWMEAQNDRS